MTTAPIAARDNQDERYGLKLNTLFKKEPCVASGETRLENLGRKCSVDSERPKTPLTSSNNFNKFCEWVISKKCNRSYLFKVISSKHVLIKSMTTLVRTEHVEDTIIDVMMILISSKYTHVQFVSSSITSAILNDESEIDISIPQDQQIVFLPWCSTERCQWMLIVIRPLRGIWSLIDTLGVRMQDVSRVNKKIICNLSKKYLCEDIKVERQNDTYSCGPLVVKHAYMNATENIFSDLRSGPQYREVIFNAINALQNDTSFALTAECISQGSRNIVKT